MRTVSIRTVFATSALLMGLLNQSVHGRDFVVKALPIPEFLSAGVPDAKAKCISAVTKGNELCASQAMIDSAAGSSAIQGVANSVDPSSTVEDAGGLAAGSRISQVTNQKIAGECAAAAAVCERSCNMAAKEFEGHRSIPNLSADEKAKLLQDQTTALQTVADCKYQFGGAAQLAGYHAGMSHGALQKALATKAAASNEGGGGTLAIGATALVGGYMLGRNSAGGSGGGSGGAGSPGSTGSSGSAGSTGSTGAANDPDCAKADANTKEKCDEVTVKACAYDVASAKCSSFADRYCGLASSTTGTSTTPPGQGSQFCKDSLASRYCQKAGRDVCFSCRDLKDRMSTTCKNTPTAAVCNQTHSNSDMAYYRSTCPDDPIWTDPKWASISPAPIGQPPTGGTATTTALGAGGVTGASGSTGLGSGSTTSASLLGAGPTALASARTYNASDIGLRFGSGVVLTNTAVIQAQCQAGQINNCGVRAH